MSVHVILHDSRQIGVTLRYDIFKQLLKLDFLEVQLIVIDFFSFANVVQQAQIEAELDRHWDRLHQGLSYYKPPRYGKV